MGWNMNVKLTACALSVAAVAAVFSATTAGAVTVLNAEIGAKGSKSADLEPGSDVLYQFNPSQKAVFSFSFAVTGFVLEDLQEVTYGFLDGQQWNFTVSETGDEVFGAIAMYKFTTDQPFTIGFFDGISETVATSFSYRVTALPAVPLPATGILLVGALGALAATRRKSRN